MLALYKSQTLKTNRVMQKILDWDNITFLAEKELLKNVKKWIYANDVRRVNNRWSWNKMQIRNENLSHSWWMNFHSFHSRFEVNWILGWVNTKIGDDEHQKTATMNNWSFYENSKQSREVTRSWMRLRLPKVVWHINFYCCLDQRTSLFQKRELFCNVFSSAKHKHFSMELRRKWKRWSCRNIPTIHQVTKWLINHVNQLFSFSFIGKNFSTSFLPWNKRSYTNSWHIYLLCLFLCHH